jgi:hypothetical protein
LVNFMVCIRPERRPLERLIESEKYTLRSCAMEALAKNWPDDETRIRLTERATQDHGYSPRIAALRALSDNWPDETTHALLVARAIHDPDADVRGFAFCVLSGVHSKFGRILATRNRDGEAPYLDPREPIWRDQIECAATECDIRPEDIDDQVASLSAYVCWNITLGAKGAGQRS